MATNTLAQTIQVETPTFYNEENGLSSYVNYIFKDSRDILWVGSQFGLYRFDGQEFVCFNEGSGLPFRQVMEIYEDREGWLWLYKSCRNKPSCQRNLAFFHPLTHKVQTFEQRFKDRVTVRADQIQSMAQDPAGIYFTAGQKLLIYSVEGNIREIPIKGLPFTPILFSKINEGLFGAVEKTSLKSDPSTGKLLEPLVYLTIDTSGNTRIIAHPIEDRKYSFIFDRPLGTI